MDNDDQRVVLSTTFGKSPGVPASEMFMNFEELPLEEQEAYLGLTLVPGIGARLAIRLLERYHSAVAVFSAPQGELQSIEGIGEALAQRLSQGFDRDRTQRIVQRLKEDDIHVWMYGSASYPIGLNRLASPPLLMYVKGKWPLAWREHRSVAIVGTRRPDPRGVHLTRSITDFLASEGWWIVSGGALGIDTTAHMTTLAVGGATVAVMATGVDCPYPAQNRDLFRQVCERGGALLSEFPPGTRPEKGYFPRRNRLISALSCGVVVVQCSAKSGALHSAACARRIGVPVMTFPGHPHESLAAGPHQLLRSGASLVESGEDILHVMKASLEADPAQLSLWGTTPSLQESIREKSESLLEKSALAVVEVEEQRGVVKEEEIPSLWKSILHALPSQDSDGLHLDLLVERLGSPVAEISSALVLLELEGLVWASADLRFGRTVSLQTDSSVKSS